MKTKSKEAQGKVTQALKEVKKTFASVVKTSGTDAKYEAEVNGMRMKLARVDRALGRSVNSVENQGWTKLYDHIVTNKHQFNNVGEDRTVSFIKGKETWNTTLDESKQLDGPNGDLLFWKIPHVTGGGLKYFQNVPNLYINTVDLTDKAKLEGSKAGFVAFDSLKDVQEDGEPLIDIGRVQDVTTDHNGNVVLVTKVSTKGGNCGYPICNENGYAMAIHQKTYTDRVQAIALTVAIKERLCGSRVN